MAEQLKQLRVKLTGFRPLVMHNGALADPANPWVQAIKKITAKGKKKTDDDLLELGRLEWSAGWYLTEAGYPMVPTDNIERMVQDGAKKSRLGKDCQAAVLCSEDGDVLIEHDLLTPGLDLPKLYGKPAFTLRKGVKVTTSRVIRVRPMVPTGWVLRFTLIFDGDIINQRALEQAIKDAGALVGLGDWRPKFGRFEAEFE